jgi:hypothetical protein
MAAQNELTYELLHGIQLTVWNTSRRMTITAVADFLAEAMRHFKHHRDDLKADLYTEGAYRRTVTDRRKVLGTMQLSYSAGQGERFLTAALWTEAVIDAYTNANQVEQMIEELPAYRKAAEKDGGWLDEVVGLLEKPGGDLQAMEVMMKKDRKTPP